MVQLFDDYVLDVKSYRSLKYTVSHNDRHNGLVPRRHATLSSKGPRTVRALFGPSLCGGKV